MHQHSIMPRLVVLSFIGAGCATPLPGSVTDGTTSIESGSNDELDSYSGPPGTSSSADEADGADGSEAGPVCGNGIVEVGETCDEAGEGPTCDVDCTDAVCGDHQVNFSAEEECDTDELADGSCSILGFDGGRLSCTAACVYDTSACGDLPATPVLELGYSQVKLLDFDWAPIMGATYYQLFESAASGEPFLQLGGDILDESISIEMPLHSRFEASYRLSACNAVGCVDSVPVGAKEAIVNAIGYIKASNTGPNDWFGYGVAVSNDGDTLAISGYFESSDATGIGGEESNDDAPNAGAVYVFGRVGIGQWAQQAYIKASNTGAYDNFGVSVALSGDGSTLAVGAHEEDSGTDVDQGDNTAPEAGAAYVFVRDAASQWSQQAYIKASNIETGDHFGAAVTLSMDGGTLGVGAPGEDSGANVIGGEQYDESAPDAGAVYIFTRDLAGQWVQEAYIKASNAGTGDWFGSRLALSGDGATLAVAALGEDGSDDAAPEAGAAYVFVNAGAGQWTEHAYVRASNSDPGDRFGSGIALAADGETLAVGADLEDGGPDGDQLSDEAPGAGAVYVYTRDPMDQWTQQAYVKSSNAGPDDWFGGSLALSADGAMLAVGAQLEDGNSSGIEGSSNDFAVDTGAAYFFERDGAGLWSQRSYVKASNTESFDHYGISLALSGDGQTLAVSAMLEDSCATGTGGSQADPIPPCTNSGAVYLY